MSMLFQGFVQVLLLELGLTKEYNNFMYILLDIVCKWMISYVKDYKKLDEWYKETNFIIISGIAKIIKGSRRVNILLYGGIQLHIENALYSSRSHRNLLSF